MQTKATLSSEHHDVQDPYISISITIVHNKAFK